MTAMTTLHRKHRWVAAGLLLALLLTSLPLTALAGSEGFLVATDVRADDRSYDWITSAKKTYTYDFSSSDITDYSTDAVLATASLRTNMIFENQVLACKEGKTFSFGSSLFLGDDYGLYGGELSFDASVTGGKLSVGLRLSRTATDTARRGIWFTLNGTDTVTVTEPESRLTATVKAPKVASVGKVTVRDKASVMELYVDDALICSVTYDSYTGALAVLDASGVTVASKAASEVRPAGYFTLFANDMKGHVDNLSFEHTELSLQASGTQGFAIDYTTWVATDDRDRTTPTGIEQREDKQVGIFYFLCQVGEDSEFIQDNTRIFLEQGLEGLNDHLTTPGESGSYYWAEPYFGYYRNVDSWVFRKHAYQLEAAGVDFIFLDFTNGAYYPEGLQTLLDTWLEIRREGGSTPEICVFSAGNYGAVMGALRGSMYSEAGFAKYGELYYQYQGKPLTLCGAYGDNSDLGKWINETFTVRDCWAWKDEDGGWNWLQEYTKRGSKYVYSSGGPGRDLNGNFEQLALCVGHHPTTSKGRSYANSRFPKITDNDYGFSLDSGAGIGFESQFDAVMHYDPTIVMITGWNEWVAGLNQTSSGYGQFAGSEDLGFQFVDQFNTEHSRDAEPMKLRQGEEVGFGDNYYYQMTSYIRQFKGTGAVTQAHGQTSISLLNHGGWENVGPVYGDNVGDVVWRQEDGYFTGTNYVNNSGRNDLVSAKVSQDAEYLYFTVTTARDVIVDNGSNWMNLFIDLDNDASTGWEGYDLVLNRARDGHYVSVESLAGGWAGAHVGQALYTVSGNRMVIRLSKAAIGLNGSISTLSFKWADNSTKAGNVMEFMDLGDTAPNDRFSYLYVCPEGEGNESVAVESYSLKTTDGTDVPPRNEEDALPGYTDADAEGDSADTEVSQTEEIVADTDEPATAPTTSESASPIVWTYSMGLKITIVLTGLVLGGCAYAAIVIPHEVKRKKR